MNDAVNVSSGQAQVPRAPNKLPYAAPSLREYGSVAALTLGNNGSCLDGNGNGNQNGCGPKL